MEDNKLIAEFMGYTHQSDSAFKDENGFWNDFEVFETWDWLMPVVQKIGDEYLNTPFDETYSHLTEQYENIWTKEDTYKAVVQFINEFNKN